MASHATRQFKVHARHHERHKGRIFDEASFEAAAIAYVEDFAHEPEGDPELSVIVLEVQSGHEHCFRINFDTGETTSCG